MEEVDELTARLAVPTNELKNNVLQEILLKIQMIRTPSDDTVVEWDKVADLLWEHLQKGHNVYDDQLLCATCFYSVINITSRQEFYMEVILKLFQNELDRNTNSNNSDIHLLISLIYGMFQSAFLQKVLASNEQVRLILNCIFHILTSLGYEYAWYTFLVFKSMSSFKKVIGTSMEKVIFSEANQIKLFNLVNHNWENPITGVRDLNRIIFQTLISVMEKSLKTVFVSNINSFYWNKAKYLMLSEIIAQEPRSMINVVDGTDWVKGIVNSLRKPGLVSAGADMYFAILKNIATAEDWCTIFLKRISATLTCKSFIAIQNFTNYWCLTTLKTFPSLMSVILKEIINTANTEQRLLSSLSLMKQGNKLGLLKPNMELVIGLNPFILQGLEHNNAHIRIAAFDIVCTSQGKCLPSKEEYNLIYQYLLNNSNSDSTILRIHLLGSLKSFLIRLHMSFINSIMSEDNAVLDEDLVLFCRQIQDLVMDSLDLDGNYQRNVTSIKLCDLIFAHFAEIPRKIKAQTRVHNCTLLGILQEKQEWKLSNKKFLLKLISLLQNPAEDVRESVSQLLLKHYFNDLRHIEVYEKLKEDALKCMSSKFFYEISCGHSMFKLIANIALKEKQENSDFRSVEAIFQFALNELVSEYKLKRDVMESIQTGKQLHSYIGVLITVLTVSLQNAYKLEEISSNTINVLLNCLEGISNQFVWEDETSISLDFSEISDMVQNIISRSGYNPSDEKDRTKISGMHQLVLNCLWFNVKTCCELSSLLIKYTTEDTQFEVCHRCLNIITHVLETSRHKGAIEAAGAALGNAIQHLTSLPEGSNLPNLPNNLLKEKINTLISEAGKMSSVTRRGAGLSIMLHRIVASDMKKGKPLFHYFMKTLLTTCKKTEDLPPQLHSDFDNEKDLPKAIYIHFLTRIVTDSSLASDLMHYSASLGELAFSNLTSKCWQIRNAALQLYGALVPKLIGQKKSSGEDEETISTVASDEFRTHLPELWKFMLRQLKCKNSANLLDHSDLVPILNIIANSARRYIFTYDSTEHESSFKELFQSLMSLLGSPIYTVRRLTVKCIFNNFPFETVYSAIKYNIEQSENFLHGYLMLTGIYHKQYSSIEEYTDMFSDLENYFTKIMKAKTRSYVTKTVFEEIFDTMDECVIRKVQSTFAEITNNQHAPGINLWAKKRVERCIKQSPWDKFEVIVKILSCTADMEQFGNVILERILRDDVLPSQMVYVSGALMHYDYDNNFTSTVIWKIIYEISLTIRIAESDITNIVYYFKDHNNTIPYKSRYMIPVIATFISFRTNDDEVERFVEFIFSLTREDFELRYIAAMANNNLSLSFGNLKDSIRVKAIKTALILLQDEDEDIRSLSVEFYENLTNDKQAPHPYICLAQLLKYEFLATVLHEPKIAIPHLCDEITDSLQTYTKKAQTKDQYNPFANDSNNIYIETVVIKKQVKKLLNSM